MQFVNLNWQFSGSVILAKKWFSFCGFVCTWSFTWSSKSRSILRSSLEHWAQRNGSLFLNDHWENLAILREIKLLDTILVHGIRLLSRWPQALPRTSITAITCGNQPFRSLKMTGQVQYFLILLGYVIVSSFNRLDSKCMVGPGRITGRVQLFFVLFSTCARDPNIDLGSAKFTVKSKRSKFVQYIAKNASHPLQQIQLTMYHVFKIARSEFTWKRPIATNARSYLMAIELLEEIFTMVK